MASINSAVVVVVVAVVDAVVFVAVHFCRPGGTNHDDDGNDRDDVEGDDSLARFNPAGFLFFSTVILNVIGDVI